MPQIVQTAHVFVRYGSYEPSTGFHFPNGVPIGLALLDPIIQALKPFLNLDISISRYEVTAANGTVTSGGGIGQGGTSASDFDDFRDMTHVTWVSDGTLGDSGNYIPARHDGHWAKGVPTPALIDAMDDLLNALITSGATDSEGNLITDFKRYSTSRRKRVRLAP